MNYKLNKIGKLSHKVPATLINFNQIFSWRNHIHNSHMHDYIYIIIIQIINWYYFLIISSINFWLIDLSNH